MGMKETLGKVIRVQTESYPEAVGRHDARVRWAEGEVLSLHNLRRAGQLPYTIGGILPNRAFFRAETRLREASSTPLVQERALVVFNHWRIPLPQVIYP